MLTINLVTTLEGEITDLTIDSPLTKTIDATGLTLFPGLIDPHVHFRTPGLEYKEDWKTAAKAAISGGYTTVFDMPNTLPPTVTATLLADKKALIDQQLREVGIPLRYELFFGADKQHLSQIHLVKQAVIGIKVFMGCSTGNLVIDDDESLHAVFAIAATQHLLVAVHAEDETRMRELKSKYKSSHDYCDHSRIRDPLAASLAVEKAISLAKIYNVRLYVLHASTKDELTLIANAKKEGLKVFAETTPHHLFLDEADYAHLHGKAVVNPPLRDKENRTAVWDAIKQGVIDTIGSDHAPHTEAEKAKAFGECPSGMPGIETTLPLLLTAYHQGEISLARIIELTKTNTEMIFQLPKNNDLVLVDLNQSRVVSNAHLKTKCGWSSFAGRTLTGWPVYTILQGHVFDLTTL